MLKLLLSVLFLFFLPFRAGAEAQTEVPDRPDVANWKLVFQANIGSRISERIPYNLGFDLIYQNPENKNEFVRLIRVIRPFLPVRNSAVLDKNFVDTMITYVTDNAERDLLKKYIIESDPVIYIRWIVKPDLKREAIQLDNKSGENEVWLCNSAGRWVYDKNVKIKKNYPSETFKDLNGDLIIVGVKYSLTKHDYIAREIPNTYISIALRASKGGK